MYQRVRGERRAVPQTRNFNSHAAMPHSPRRRGLQRALRAACPKLPTSNWLYHCAAAQALRIVGSIEVSTRVIDAWYAAST